MKYVYGTGHPVFNPSGNVREFVGMVMDRDRTQAGGRSVAPVAGGSRARQSSNNYG